jgi:hypothetical protein
MKEFQTNTQKKMTDSTSEIKKHLEVLRTNALYKLTKKSLALK